MANQNNNNNPFSEVFKNFGDWSNFNPNNFNPNKMSMDMNNLSTMQKRTAETISHANQLFTEGLHSIMRRNAEIAQNNAAELFHLIKDVVVSPNQEHTISKQAEFVRSAVENGVANTKEIAEMVTKSTMELFELMSKNFSENLQECVATANNKKKAA